MKKENLEHIVRAVGDVIQETEIYVIGSQSIFGQHPDIENYLLHLKKEGKIKNKDINNILGSREADIMVIHDEAKSDIIDGILGELSPYHDTFGYYADGVNEETAKLPYDWKDRVNKIQNENTRWVTAYCLDTHDAIVAKLFANREKDIDYIRSLVKVGLVDETTIHERLDKVDISSLENGDTIVSNAHSRINKIFNEMSNE